MQAALHAEEPAPRPVTIGLLGCGVVGSRVARGLLEEPRRHAEAVGAPLVLKRIAVRRLAKPRPSPITRDLLSDDPLGVAIDPDVDVVVEVMGGIRPALDCLRAALADNKSVVTANKELLARHGDELLGNLEAEVFFEASVGGAIPILRVLRESCAGDYVENITGILNGTNNFVLSLMTSSGCSQEEALVEARRRGYAEADPSADIQGFDAAAKVAVLARVAFGVPVTMDQVEREGIAGIGPNDVSDALRRGYVYKFVATARRTSERVDLRVHPELVPLGDPLARIEGAENIVFVDARRAGRLSFHGAGAGGDPTAAAVLGDIVDAARRRVARRGRLRPCW